MSAVNEPTVTTPDKDEVKSTVGSDSGEEPKLGIKPLVLTEDPHPTNPKPDVDEPATSSTTEDSASKAKAVEDPKPAPVSFADPQIATQEAPKPLALWGQPEPSASGSKHAEHEDNEDAKGEDPSVSPSFFYSTISKQSSTSASCRSQNKHVIFMSANHGENQLPFPPFIGVPTRSRLRAGCAPHRETRCQDKRGGHGTSFQDAGQALSI